MSYLEYQISKDRISAQKIDTENRFACFQLGPYKSKTGNGNKESKI